MKNSSWRVRWGLIVGMMLGVIFLSACTFKFTVSDEMKYYCETDTDCVNSCGYGAVNFFWYQEQEEPCDDGCAWDGMGAPQCIENGCVAFLENGTEDASCTRK